MIKQDEFTRHITLKAGMFAFHAMMILSLISTVLFAMRRNGVIELDEYSMNQIVSLPWQGGIVFFTLYRWMKGAVEAEQELAGRTSQRYAFKKVFLISALGSAALTLFSYFYIFNGNLEVTLITGFILLATLTAISYFTFRKAEISKSNL